MAEFHIPVTEYNEWRTNELPFTAIPFVVTLANLFDTRYVAVPNDGRVQLIFKVTHNANGRAIVAIPPRGDIDGLDIIGSTTLYIPRTDTHGVDRELLYTAGPFDPKVFNNDDGEVEISYNFLAGHGSVFTHYYLAAIRS